MTESKEFAITLAKSFVTAHFNALSAPISMGRNAGYVYEIKAPEDVKKHMVEIEGVYKGAGNENETIILKDEDAEYQCVLGNETVYSRSITADRIKVGERLYTIAIKVQNYQLYIPVVMIRESEKNFFMKIHSLFGRANAIKDFYHLEITKQDRIMAQTNPEYLGKVELQNNNSFFETRKEIMLWYALVKDTLPIDTQKTIERMFNDDEQHRVDTRLRLISRIAPMVKRSIGVDADEVKSVLDQSFYKMEKVKRLIVDVIMTIEHAQKKGCALLFVGPPGVGKTAFMMKIADLMDLPYECLAMNGLSAPLELEGLSSCYDKADAGVITKAFAAHGTSQMVLALDEFDKIHNNSKEGNPYNIFLRMMLGNHYDKFLECTIKTDHTIFIATANSTEDIPEYILNRFDSVIYFDEYNVEDKMKIAKDFVIPDVLENYNLNHLIFEDETLKCIITRYCEDDGIRDVRHNIERVCARVIGCNLADTPMKITEDFAKSVLEELIEETPGLTFSRSKDLYTEPVAREIKKALIATKKNPSDDPDVFATNKIRKKLDYLLACRKEKTIFLEEFHPETFYDRLHKDMFGMENVIKEVVNFFFTEYLQGNRLNSNLALCGGYGTGKSSIVKSIADVMDYKCQKISLNGVEDMKQFRGISSSYAGSEPGCIVKGIKKAGSTRMILQLDEIDKLNPQFSTAIIDLLDGEFTDHFLEVPIDLSQTIIIATANDWSKVPTVVRDRFIVVDVKGYRRKEKKEIITDYIIPRLEKSYEANKVSITMDEPAIKYLLKTYAKSFGVRDAEKAMQNICSNKLLDQVGSDDPWKVRIDKNDVTKYLGKEPIPRGNFPNKVVPGISKALAVSNGNMGLTFAIETVLLEGNEGIEITGLPKEMAIDSVKICVTCIKKMYPNILKGKSVHVHFGEGSVPKDGPSAGTALFLSILSAAVNKPVTTGNQYDLAFTGEIGLTGSVFAVGGVLEKLQAASDSGCTKVFIPMQNYERLDQNMLNDFECEVIGVSHVSEIVETVYPDFKENSYEEII